MSDLKAFKVGPCLSQLKGLWWSSSSLADRMLLSSSFRLKGNVLIIDGQSVFPFPFYFLLLILKINESPNYKYKVKCYFVYLIINRELK